MKSADPNLVLCHIKIFWVMSKYFLSQKVYMSSYALLTIMTHLTPAIWAKYQTEDWISHEAKHFIPP